MTRPDDTTVGEPVGDVAVRPLRSGDVAAAAQLGHVAIAELGTREQDPPAAYDGARREWAEARMSHLLATDPDGCWLAEAATDGGSEPEPVGVALASVRDGHWFLSLLTVRRDRQAAGIGKALLERALRTRVGARGGSIVASSDPKALRRYAAAGFALHPGYSASGALDPARVAGASDRAGARLVTLEPVGDGVGDAVGGLPGKVRDRLDAVDLEARGARRGPDWELFAATGQRVLLGASAAGSGYAVLRAGALSALTATTPRYGRDLLLAAFEQLAGEPEAAAVTDARVMGLTGRTQWAIEATLTAGLALGPGVSICLWGDCGTRAAVLPSGALG